MGMFLLLNDAKPKEAKKVQLLIKMTWPLLALLLCQQNSRALILKYLVIRNIDSMFNFPWLLGKTHKIVFYS